MNNNFFSPSNYQKPQKVKHSLIVILSVLLFGGLVIPTNSSKAQLSSRVRAKDAAVQARVAELQTIAEIIHEENGSYLNVNCNYGEIKTICEDIEKEVGTKPVIHQSADKYCVYTKSIQPSGEYFCTDSAFTFRKTYIDPGGSTYCTETTFLCPTETGTIPPSANESSPDVIFYSLLTKILFFGGIFLSLILSVIIHYFRRKKEKSVKIENSNTPIPDNLEPGRAFYVWLTILIISIILYSYNFLILSLPLLIGFIAAVGVCYQIIKLIKKSKKTVYQKLCWEGFSSMIAIVVVWLIFFISQIQLSSTSDFTTDTHFLYIYFLGGLAIGFSVSILFHKWKINKIIGAITLLLMLYFSLFTGLWIFFLG